MVLPEPPGPTSRTIAQHSSGYARKRGLLPPSVYHRADQFDRQTRVSPSDAAPGVIWPVNISNGDYTVMWVAPECPSTDCAKERSCYYIRNGCMEPLTPAVFHILLSLVDGEKHGYGIMQEVAARTGNALIMGPGTLYGTLKRMLAAGLVEECGERSDPRMDISAGGIIASLDLDGGPPGLKLKGWRRWSKPREQNLCCRHPQRA